MLHFDNGNYYVYCGDKKLRCGVTSGACAALAAKTASQCFFGEKNTKIASFLTSSGILLRAKIAFVKWQDSFCTVAGIIKDSGDDIDSTDGIEVDCTVRFFPCEKQGLEIKILGGEGVGIVTKEGLKIGKGQAAINPLARLMIEEATRGVCEEKHFYGKVEITVSVPQGRQIAQSTFNSRLGIEGGISILGTTGLVLPQSEAAFLDCIELELRQISTIYSKNRLRHLVITIGNHSKIFATKLQGFCVLPNVICGNYIGKTLDIASQMGWTHITIFSAIGKLIKLSGGIMNTKSNIADCRLELLTYHATMCGVKLPILKAIADCNTVEEGIAILGDFDTRHNTTFLPQTIAQIYRKTLYYINRRLKGASRVSVIMYSEKMGIFWP